MSAGHAHNEDGSHIRDDDDGAATFSASGAFLTTVAATALMLLC
jgi:hypothetical protein